MKCPLICHQESIKDKPLFKCRKIFLHVFFVDHFRSNSPWYSVIFNDIPWHPIIIAHCFYHVVASIFIPWILYSYSIYMPYISTEISLVLNAAPLRSPFPPQRGRPTAARGTSRCRCRWTPQRPGEVLHQVPRDIAWWNSCWVYGTYNVWDNRNFTKLWIIFP